MPPAQESLGIFNIFGNMEPIFERFFLNLSQSFFKPLGGGVGGRKGKVFLLAKLCCSRRAHSFHSEIVKNFPVCPLQCGCQPTNHRHSAARQRGSDANLGATGNHYWHQTQCLPFFFLPPRLALHKQNGGSCSNGTAEAQPSESIASKIFMDLHTATPKPVTKS